MERLVMHVDMDAFFASVEQLDHEEYRGKPLIVGGLGGRGVVSTCSYEARRFGVHSAMPMGRAQQLCPQGIFIAGNYPRYAAVSTQIFAIFARYSPVIEPLSIDEAFLDLTGMERLMESPRQYAQALKTEIREQTGIVASVGIAPNKFLAKLASDIEKPDGLVIITKENMSAILEPLPVGRIWGVGRKMGGELAAMHIRTIGDLRRVDHTRLAARLGERMAGHLLALAHGIDEAAHRGGLAHQRTIAVMGTGLDTIYPAQHKQLAEEIRQSGAIVTEFLPATLPLAAFFPRRNRIVSGLSLGVLVVEAALKSGSITTANAAANQGKMVFAIPGHIYSEHHQGCHQLIREGATLVDHPEQIIEDLALPTQWQAQQQRIEDPKETVPPPPSLPTHLIELYQILDWVGQDLDQLAQRYSASIADLTAQLMELELLGLCIQQGGRYLRCRPMH